MSNEEKTELITNMMGLDLEDIESSKEDLKRQIKKVSDDLSQSSSESYLYSDDLVNAARRLYDLASKIDNLKAREHQAKIFKDYKDDSNSAK